MTKPLDTRTHRIAAKGSSVGHFLSQIHDRINGNMQPLWRDRRIAMASAIGCAAVWGAVAGWWTPRSPLTSAQALWSIGLSLVVGALAGLVTRSRWAMLTTPVAFATVFEFTRLDIAGPTVDKIHFSTYGTLAFVVGRGFHAALSLIPMVLGASVGAGVARRSVHDGRTVTSNKRVSRYARTGVAALLSTAVLALAVGLARPATTASIVGSDGKVLPGSIAELRTVNVNGHKLSMMIRGQSVSNPVLLFLAGGPGGSEMGAMRKHLPLLEERFTVVTWDQRGTGRSYPELDPISTVTVSGAVTDTIAVTDYLRNRFKQPQIYLSGQSWGSILGVLALQKRPMSYRAFVGIGQMVSPVETDRIFYQDTLTWAQKTGKTGLVKRLRKIGQPPYTNMLDYETALSYEHEVHPYDTSKNSEGAGGFSENFFVSEYSLIDQVHLLAGFLDTFASMYPQIQDLDFRVSATHFTVPMYFVEGVHEAPGRSIPFKEWFATIDAPVKKTVEFDTSGHRPLFEQPDRFVAFMTNTVLTDAEKTNKGQRA